MKLHISLTLPLLVNTLNGSLDFAPKQDSTPLPPSFFNLGCTKCGTTSFHNYLLHHPDVAPTCASFHHIVSQERRVQLNAQISAVSSEEILANVADSWPAIERIARDAVTIGGRKTLDAAYMKVWAYTQRASKILWSKYERALSGEDALTERTRLSYVSATRALEELVDVMSADELVESRHVAQKALRQFTNQQLTKTRHLNGTLAPVVCDVGRQLYVKKEPKHYGSTKSLLGHMTYVSRVAPRWPPMTTEYLPLRAATPPIVGDFTACTLYGCEWGRPLAVARDLQRGTQARSKTLGQPAARARVRLLVLVCDPVRRAHSYLKMTCKASTSHKCDDSLNSSVAVGLRHLSAEGCAAESYVADRAAWIAMGCLERSYSPAARALVRGLYGEWLAPWLQVFGGGPFHVLELEALMNDGQRAMDGVHAHLGLRPFRYDESLFMSRLNVARDQRANAKQRYVPEIITRNATLMGRHRAEVGDLVVRVMRTANSHMCELLQSYQVPTSHVSLCAVKDSG